MSTQPLFSPKYRALDGNGNPLSGGKLYSYAAGTTTPQATYTTYAGDVPNANPVVLNANGEADVWGTPGLLYKFVLQDASNVTQWTVDNVPIGSSSSSSSSGTSDPNTLEPGGRLTLTSGTPVVNFASGVSTVYYTPYKHNQVPIYDGSKWTLFTFTELSQAAGDATKSPAAVVANANYDLFVWSDSGTLRLSRGPAWLSVTSRGTGAGSTELQLIGTRNTNKWAISNGPAANTGLYVGTVNSSGSALFDDTAASRRVWNAYNRVLRDMSCGDGTSSWTYSAAAFRQANNNTNARLLCVVGLSVEAVSAEVMAQVLSTTTDQVNIALGIGGIILPNSYRESTVATSRTTVRARYVGQPTFGVNTFQWLEAGGGTGTVTWFSGGIFAGMFGTVVA